MRHLGQVPQDVADKMFNSIMANARYSYENLKTITDDELTAFLLLQSGRYSFTEESINESITQSEIDAIISTGQICTFTIQMITSEHSIPRKEKKALLKEIKKELVRKDNEAKAKMHSEAK